MTAAPVTARSVVLRVATRVVRGPVLDHGAQVAFYAVLSLAPFLVVLTSLAAFLPSADTVARLLHRAEVLMPPDAYRVVARVVDDVVAQRHTGFLTVGLATALWSASRAVNALRRALNSAFAVEDRRSWVRAQLVALALTIGGAGLLLGSVVASLVGNHALERLAAALATDFGPWSGHWALLRWPLALGGIATLAALSFRVLPDARPQARAVWLGAGVATALFIASSLLFSFYAQRIVDYGPTYGSLTGGVLLLLWAWLAAIAFIVGGEVTAAFPAAPPRA